VRCCGRYRRYSDNVPALLHNRPHDVVQHVMVRYGEGLKFRKESVIRKGVGHFQVQSATDSSLQYMLYFDADGMPSCDCFDWKRFHLPCKHFCAVFALYPDSGWDKFPAGYRDSPFFTVDDSIVGPNGEGQKMAATLSEGTHDPTCEFDDTDNDGVELQQYCKQKAVACRELLSALVNSTYLVDSTDGLDTLYSTLQKAYTEVVPFIPSESGVQLNSVAEGRKRHVTVRQANSKRRRLAATNSRDDRAEVLKLPLRKTKKGWCVAC